MAVDSGNDKSIPNDSCKKPLLLRCLLQSRQDWTDQGIALKSGCPGFWDARLTGLIQVAVEGRSHCASVWVCNIRVNIVIDLEWVQPSTLRASVRITR